MRARALWVAWLLLGLLFGCHSQPPRLLGLRQVVPSRVDQGDRVEVLGTGFPEGRTATLTFEGTVFRPGKAKREAHIVTKGHSESQESVSFALTEELQLELCGRDGQADHATFRGRLTVAFASRNAVAPPVTGQLEDLVLNIAGPGLSEASVAARMNLAKSWLDFVGIRVKGEHAPFVVDAVLPKSRAAQAGLLQGDELVALDEVTLETRMDLVPTLGERWSRLSLLRGRMAKPLTLLVAAEGFHDEPPRDLWATALLVGFPIALVLMFMAPVARVITWLERRLATQLRATGGAGVWRLLREPVNRALAIASSGRPLRTALAYAILIGVSGVFTAMALGRPPFARDFDVVVLYLGSCTATLIVGLIGGGVRHGLRWSLWAGLKAALTRLIAQLPGVVAFIAIVLTSDGIGSGPIVSAQDGLPWGWHAFRSPVNLVAFALFLLASIPEPPGESGALLPEADSSQTGIKHEQSSLLRLIDLGVVFTLSGVAALLFAGGWRVPGILGVDQNASVGWSLLGVGVFLGKCWAIALLVMLARWALPRLQPAQLRSLYFRWLLPSSLMVMGAATVFAQWLNGGFIRSLFAVTGYVTCALCAFTLVYLARRVSLNLRTTAPQLNVNPWL